MINRVFLLNGFIVDGDEVRLRIERSLTVRLDNNSFTAVSDHDHLGILCSTLSRENSAILLCLVYHFGCQRASTVLLGSVNHHGLLFLYTDSFTILLRAFHHTKFRFGLDREVKLEIFILVRAINSGLRSLLSRRLFREDLRLAISKSL